jgi:hypothetical protein
MSELEGQLDATNMDLFRAREKIKAMDTENENLKNLTSELLRILRQTPASVSGYCVHLVQSDDLTPHQDTFDTQ